MVNLNFKKLIENAKVFSWKDIFDSLIFANITFELDGKVQTGEYEFINDNPSIEEKEKQEKIKDAINDSFKKIEEKKCFSLYKYLAKEKIRYARIVRTGQIDTNDLCHFSTGSIDDDINSNKKPIVVINEDDALNKINQDGIPLMTILEEYDSYYVVLGEEKDKLFFYLVRPSLDNDKLTGLLYFSSTQEIPFEALKELAALFADELINILFGKMQKEAEKSAKAAIMSRNMSHNLGSHVMAYLKNDLRNVPTILTSSVLHNLFPDRFPLGEVKKIAAEVELPFLVGLGYFIGYLQERQDYIATIASSYIPPFSPVNFKDSIYDELNPDMRFERHHGNDPDNHNKPQNILLSYIAKSEKLSRIKTDNPKNHDILLGFKHKGKVFGLSNLTNNSKDETLTPMRFVNFALPGGIVGRQAVFSIVENIIRNAAKHNNVQGDLQLTFETIDGEELKANPDGFEDSLYSTSIRNLYKNSVDIEHLIIMTITDNQECQDPTIDKLRNALRQPYIGEHADSNKGIKEIRISATWLRGEEDDSQFAPCPLTDSEPVAQNLKAPIVVIEKSKEGNLRYSICLKKTYEFALVYDEGDDDDNKTSFIGKFQLNDGSYKVVSASSIITSDTCYEYIIAENAFVFNDIRPYVTNRCIQMEDIVFDALKKITPEMIYEAFARINDDSPCIVIDDDRVENILYRKKIKRASYPYEDGLFMYRSHHFSEKDFGAYWIDRAEGKYPKNIACIDGISGDNSSDRLVRREKLDKKWYIGHLYAMQSRVAILDERLFQIVHGLDESQMTMGSYAASKFSNLCSENKWPKTQITDLDLCKLAINQLYIQSADDILMFVKLYKACLEDSDGIEEANGFSNRERMINFLEPFRFKFQEHVEGHQHLTAAYAEKGIDVYTIIPLGDRECLIVGNSGYEYKKESTTPIYDFEFKPLAHIWCDENKEFHIDSLKKFKYISIHQGLVDKMYTEFGIEDDDADSKKALLLALYNGLMAGKDLEHKDSFMPRLTIHSGRGNITRKDMPNNQPFLQYSAIEHAVLDCKYALVELLDFAKYKKS